MTSVLKQYEGMPNHLFIQGSLPKTRPVCVAIVGSRRPSPYGVQVTHDFASYLAKKGVVILSGLAYGVDTIAHTACLEAGGQTVAVLGGGLHSIYPKGNTALARRIVENGGALISEYGLGVEPRPYFFLARNRLVSGLADAVLITEATARSGTFSTLAHAVTQNKEVFAVPGPITSLLSAGPNHVLQTGAHVACTPEDILQVIAPQLLNATPLAALDRQLQIPLGSTPLENAIIQAIRRGVHDGEALQEQFCERGSVAEFLQALTMLELNGLIQNMGGNTWILR